MERGKGADKFLILDGHSLAYRAFFALPLELQTKKGLHTNAVLGFTNMLLRLIKDESPDYLLVTFDYPAPTFRHHAFSEYKATREKTPLEMKEQMPLIKEILDAFRIPVYELEGYEADDLIGTLAAAGEHCGLDTYIVTADADAYQLLSPKIKILITRKGISQLEEFNLEKLLDKYGLDPLQWIDFKALKGDSSDNIPGVPGIGEKRALQLLKEYGSLLRVIESVNNIPGKLGESLSAYSEQALLSKELATIRKDVPIAFQLEDSRYETPDWELLYQIFKRLEFNNLAAKIPELSGLRSNVTLSVSKKQEESKDIFEQSSLWDEASNNDSFQNAVKDDQRGGGWYQHLEDIKDLEKLCNALCEGEGGFFSLLAVGISSRENDAGFFFSPGGDDVYYIPMDGLKLPLHEVLRVMGPIFENPLNTFITHDLKPLVKYLAKKNIHIRSGLFDTLLAAYLIEPDRPAYNLSVLFEEYLCLQVPEEEKGLDEEEKKKHTFRFFSFCARNIFNLKGVLLKCLEASELKKLFFELELPLVFVLAKMELTGILVKEDVLEKLAVQMDDTLLLLEKEIIELAGMDFNLNSPRQLSFVLFEQLQLPVLRRIKTGFSTDARVLQELSASHPIAAKIIEYRTISKIKTTYLEGLRSLIKPSTGKIHTTFNQAVTATGRLSSRDPNLQNIPIRLEEGRRLRYAFRPSSEGNLLLSADYSQVELRIMAHLSGDANLIDAFSKNQDIHTRTAAEVFNVPLEDVTPFMRNAAKAVNFGIIYGISDYGLSQDLHISRAEAKKYINTYFEHYPGVKTYIHDCIKMARVKGYVTTLMNRRRCLADINHSNFTRRSFAERMARNTPIQGSAADIIKAAMLSIDRYLDEKKLRTTMLLQVHDELIFDVFPEELDEVSSTVKTLMEGVLPLSVLLKVDLKVGTDWYNLYPLEGG
ncbi:MAG: DNA polymerase I [Bacillota bacterium]|nr:DNA polymerase I [Bacillota bacterium]